MNFYSLIDDTKCVRKYYDTEDEKQRIEVIKRASAKIHIPENPCLIERFIVKITKKDNSIQVVEFKHNPARPGIYTAWTTSPISDAQRFEGIAQVTQEKYNIFKKEKDLVI